jgi:hypothetical protein
MNYWAIFYDCMSTSTSNILCNVPAHFIHGSKAYRFEKLLLFYWFDAKSFIAQILFLNLIITGIPVIHKKSQLSCYASYLSNGVFKGLGAFMWGRAHHQSGPISFERSWLTIYTTHQSSLHSCQTENPVQNPTSSLLYSFFRKTYCYVCSPMFSGNTTRKYRPINKTYNGGFD